MHRKRTHQERLIFYTVQLGSDLEKSSLCPVTAVLERAALSSPMACGWPPECNSLSHSKAMHLVYRALEKEPVPSVLPPSLIPPSKRKKTVFPGAVPVLPASPPPKDSLRSTPSHGSVSSLNSTGSLSPKHSIKQTQVRGPLCAAASQSRHVHL